MGLLKRIIKFFDPENTSIEPEIEPIGEWMKMSNREDYTLHFIYSGNKFFCNIYQTTVFDIKIWAFALYDCDKGKTVFNRHLDSVRNSFNISIEDRKASLMDACLNAVKYYPI